MNLLERIDYQGYKHILTVNNERGMKTTFGGVLTLLLTILSILSIVAFGRSLINRLDPVVFSSNTKEEIPVLSLNSFRSFRAAISLTYAAGFPIPDIDRMVDLTSSEINTDPANEIPTTRKSYATDTCLERGNFTETQKDELASNFISNNETYKCLYEGFENDLSGTFGESKFILWGFNLQFCVNSTKNNNHCYSKEDIREKLKRFYAHLILETNYVDSNSYESPMKFTYSGQLIILSSVSYRRDLIIYRLLEYTSDDGFMLENKVTRNGFEILSFDRDVTYDPETDIFYRAQFTLDRLKTKYTRIYTKVQKVAADVGGIIKFLSLILFFIGKKYSETKFYDYFIKDFIQKYLKNSKKENNQNIRDNNLNFSKFNLSNYNKKLQ